MKRSRLALISVFVLMNLVVALVLIPSAQASALCSQYYTVQRGDNLYRIGLRYNTTVTALQALNGMANANVIYAGQTLCVVGVVSQPQPVPQTPAPSGATYTVQPGNTLTGVARQFNVGVSALASLNGLQPWSWLYVGQVLRIPVGGNVPTGGLNAGYLSILEAPNVTQSNGIYYVSNAGAFFVTTNPTNALGVAFYLQDPSGNTTLLGEDTYGGDGWGVGTSLPYSVVGTMYAIAYNNRGEVAQSNVISVRR